MASRGLKAVGHNVLRKEGIEKVTGAARYLDDLPFPNLLHARTIRSTIPAGEIADIRFNFDTAGFAIVEADTLADAVEIVSRTPCAVAQGVVEVWPLDGSG